MRRILLGIILPILLLAAVGGGVWFFLRTRNAPAPASTAQTNGGNGGTQDFGGDEQAESLRVGAQANIQVPTNAQHRASTAVERDPFPEAYVEEGEPTYIETPGAFTALDVVVPVIPNEPEVVPVPSQTTGSGGAPVTPVLTGSLDEDRDGLTTDQELQLGTSPQRADTDGDGLTDGDEVRVYNTDPLNPDTDGDSYLDGAEVRAGYNPNGQGAL